MDFTEDKAAEAAGLLRALGNARRLMILCHLAAEGELSAGALVSRSGLSQSALSQHLARLREEGLIAYRRESQSLVYRVDDPRAEQLLDFLRPIFCPELGQPNDKGGSEKPAKTPPHRRAVAGTMHKDRP